MYGFFGGVDNDVSLAWGGWCILETDGMVNDGSIGGIPELVRGGGGWDAHDMGDGDDVGVVGFEVIDGGDSVVCFGQKDALKPRGVVDGCFDCPADWDL